MQTKMFQSKNIWVLVQSIMCYDSIIIIDLRLISKKHLNPKEIFSGKYDVQEGIIQYVKKKKKVTGILTNKLWLTHRID